MRLSVLRSNGEQKKRVKIMSKKMFLAATIVLGTAFTPLIALADDSTTTTSAPTTKSEMSKDDWLSSMIPMLPELICKGFVQDADLKKRFDELKLTYEQCVTLIPESSKKCQDQLYASIPATINEESAATWGRKIGECIGKDFAEQHLIPK